MARRRRRKTSNGRRYRYRSYQTSKWAEGLNFDLELDPAVVREMAAILLVGVGLFTLLAILGGAGDMGRIFYTTLRLGFGWVSFFIPLLLAGAGVAMFFPVRYKFKLANAIGLALFVVSLSGLMHVFTGSDISLELAQLGDGGGYLGFFVSRFLINIVDFWAAFLILSVAFAVSLLFAFGQPLRELYLRTKLSLPALPTLPDIRINNDFANGQEAGEEEGDEAEEAGAKPRGPLVRRAPVKKDTDFVPQFKPTGDWTPPSLELLSDVVTKVDSGNISGNVGIIQETLDDFGIAVEMNEVNVGPTVTQYTLKPAAGVKLSRISALSNDLALALAAHPIRIEAPIPGRSLVGIEVPNKKTALVRLREVMESEEFHVVKSPLRIPLGRDVAGVPVATDLLRMPHLLIAGATGAGKSVFLNDLLVSLLYQNSPADLRLILVDPKRVEFTAYNDIPHLLSPVIVDPHKTINALKWLVMEMERRYKVMAEAKVREISQYNRQEKDSPMPYIALIIDELADLMAVSAREVEAYICRLAQMSRAVGIHLVLATQRPSVDVITGLIKANFPSRIAFAVTSGTDSRTILDTVGADKLLGNGDMLFMPSDAAKPKRIQASFVGDKEVKSVTNALKELDAPQYVEEVIKDAKRGGGMFGGEEGGDDDLAEEAMELVVKTGKASASYLQRRFRIGYARAARLLDILEERGVIGPGEGAKPRDVLMKKEDLVGAIAGGGVDVDEGTKEEFKEGEDY
ncbi:MAG: putative cell division FtsK/SpoIIIE [candidate division Kazan bacterium GW2011_GWA1_50_15]|uniref:Cell division FtsK/SpoIIIE n=2 Tax=Bacteria division Kazan-3B-28 TaxID=1798534 RepID=A0A0G1X879_UNCK3|nr:MAG: putative cell division FtsK/SpoIIIE [candidate division Kazan bacterium GW2011_GWA1_50_15]KKW25794.1 MAG: cell division FtsK/SpoIIIE [candidate division Kazan bacterium GW2011_GWC1_52_13]KKW27191.1 MAG: cell division FtsK/SpoIIIE [candidate division Kazan bacterium GW2011_GWB1_52_7]HCR42481.1 cell division protein FtsK [Patescibacteria group bacterium]